MDIKITFDISDKLDSALSRIASAIQTVRATEKPDAPAEAEILPVETSEPVEVSKPAETVEVPAEAKADTQDAPKRSRRKSEPKAEPVKAEPAPEPAKEDAPAEAEILPVETPAPVDVPKPAETAEVPAEEKADAPAEQKEESAAAELTLDEVRAICVKATKKGKTKVVTDFLGAHGAASLPKLDPKFYSELAAVVEAVL